MVRIPLSPFQSLQNFELSALLQFTRCIKDYTFADSTGYNVNNQSARSSCRIAQFFPGKFKCCRGEV